MQCLRRPSSSARLLRCRRRRCRMMLASLRLRRRAHLDHRQRSGEPVLAHRRQSRQADRAEKLGYTANVGASKGRHQHREQPDRHRHHQQVGGDHSRSGQRQRIDRRGEEGRSPRTFRCSWSTPRSTRRAWPRAQLVSNNAQGAAIGGAAMGQDGRREGQLRRAASASRPTTTPRRARTAMSRCSASIPDSRRSASKSPTGIAPRATTRCRRMLQAHPDIIGVISGNDEMALGAIAALKEAGKLCQDQGRRLRRLARRGRGDQGRRTAVHRAAAGRDVLEEGGRRGRLRSSRPARPAPRARSSCSTASSSPRTTSTR